MMRLFLWLLGGVVLGGIIHIMVILTLPRLTEDTVWTRLAALEPQNRMVVLPPVKAGAPNPLQLDPEMIYGVCEIDLSDGPSYVSAILPDAFWSIAVFNHSGIVTYSTTNRDGIGKTLELGVFNAAQTRLLAQQQIDVAEGTLVIEAASNQLMLVVSLAPPHHAMRARFADELAKAQCGPRPD
jgi:uncharacterized membrane protein